MGAGSVVVGPAFAVVLAVLVAAAAAAARAAGLRLSRPIVTASVRAAAQLAVVSVVITWVLTAWGLTAAFVALMVAIAAVTSARRIGRDRSTGWAVLAIVAGTAPVCGLVVAAGTVPPHPVAVVPVAGILIGGAMTATSLAGRAAMDDLTNRRGEYEALLALGFLEPDAVRELCRPSVARALYPALDQTRTVGLVTLPGAFVGVLLGGGSPVAAGATQLLVLVGLLLAETVAIVVVIELIAQGVIRGAAAQETRN
jgi:putative ABC transport system permease protein